MEQAWGAQTEEIVDYKELLIKDIITGMVDLDSRSLKKLELVLRTTLRGLDIQKECTEISTDRDDNEYIFRTFFANKKLENLSEKSLTQYIRTTQKMLDTVGKSYTQVTTDDIKYYLASYQQKNKVSPNTVLNMKRFISAFFSWAQEEGFVQKNPCASIRNMKQIPKEKVFLTDEEKEMLRDSCRNIRELALVDFLLSTGVRVSELVSLDRSDIDFERGTVHIYATKSRRHREGYLNARAKKHLKEYLDTRTDSDPALFVGSRGEHKRLSTCGVQYILREINKVSGVRKRCSVHIFRKTLATTLSRNGCEVQYISMILGHAEIGTTQKCYISLDRSKAQMEFQRCYA